MKKFFKGLVSIGLLLFLWTALTPIPKVRADTSISSVSISLLSPQAWNIPDYDLGFGSGSSKTCCLSGLNDSDVCENGIYWVDLTENRTMYVENDPFKAGHQYKVIINVFAKYGYEFTADSTASVNGDTSTVCELNNNTLKVSYIFPIVEAQETINSVSITIDVPKAGEHMDFEPECPSGVHYSCYIEKEGIYNVSWSDWTINRRYYAAFDYAAPAFVTGHIYTLSIGFWSDLGYQFIDDLTVTVNGKPAVYDIGYETHGWRCLGVDYTFRDLADPLITTQPQDVSVKEGKTAAFTVACSATGLTYQWQYKKPGESVWNNVAKNGTSASYSFTAAARHNGYSYRCKVTDSYGDVYSDTAVLTVKPTITTQPAAAAVNEGKTATFKVVASGTGLTYRWQYKKPGESAWNNVANNGTSATYSFTAAARHNGYTYRCKVTNGGGGYVYSAGAKLIVKPADAAQLKITKQPADTVVNNEGNTAKVSLTATGDGLVYKWYVKDPGDTKYALSSNTTNTYSIKMTAAKDGHQVYCVVKDEYGDTVTSKTAVITINYTLTITKQPANTEVEAEGDIARVSITAKGKDITYTWYAKDPGDTKFYLSSNTTDTYAAKVTAEKDGRQVYCVLTDFRGTVVTSDIAVITIKPVKPAITTQPKSVTVAAGGTAKFTVAATGGSLNYQWYYRTSSTGSWTAVSAASGKTASYSLTAQERHNGYQYRCKVSNKAGSVYTSIVKLTVK